MSADSLTPKTSSQTSGPQTSAPQPKAKPFTRLITTPQGWPWQQTRMAQLEAQHTSPVALQDVRIFVKRLEPWALGQGGRFVGIYLRGAEAHLGQTLEIDVQGQSLRLEVTDPSLEAHKWKDRLYLGALWALVIIALGILGFMSLQHRLNQEAQISEIEAKIDRLKLRSRASGQTRQEAQALELYEATRLRPGRVMSDLKTLSLDRDPAVQIDAFYWNRGYWGVESHGLKTPIDRSDLHIERMAKPIKRGVYLWVAKPDQEALGSASATSNLASSNSVSDQDMKAPRP